MKALELADNVDPLTDDAYANQWMLQAAAELRRLAEVNAELLEALAPFAAFAAHYPKEGGRGNRATSGAFYSVASGDLGEATINVEDFHRAATLIAKATEQQ